jgi:6-phosphogluconolactonase
MAQVYIGSYTFTGGEGIYRLSVSKDEGFGFLGGDFTDNPSYLAFSPDKETLYAACEVGPSGKLRAYRVNGDGSLAFLNEESAVGGGSCHVSASPDGKWLFASNYGQGSESVFPLNADGSIQPIARHIVHRGSGPDKKRQERPHVHFSRVTPDGSRLAICDLGLDHVYLYPYSAENGVEDPCYALDVPAGDGPRHLTFSSCGNFLYLLTEMGSNVVVYALEDGKYAQKQVISSLPSDFDGLKWGAAIRLSPDGKWIVASNRTHDSLAVFAIGPDGLLTKKQTVSSGGKTPRDFDFIEDGSLVVVAHQDGGGVALFSFDSASGTLEDTGKRFEIDKPVGVLTR